MMTKYLFPLLALLSLLASTTACVADSYGALPNDPYALKAIAEGGIAATESARIQQVADATLAAAVDTGRTENEQERLMLPLRASQTAIGLGNEQAAATSVAAVATATAGSQMATATGQAAILVATQRAGEMDIAQRQFELDRLRAAANIYDTVLPWIVIISMIGAIGLLFILAWRGFDWLIAWIDRRQSMRETRRGEIMIYVPRLDTWQRAEREGAFSAGIKGRALPTVRAQTTTFEQITPSVTRSSITRPARDARGLAHTLVLDAMDVAGSDAKVIPSLAELEKAGKPWNAEKRDSAVNILENARAVYTMIGRGTYLTDEYVDLGDLEAEINGGHLSFAPTLPMAGD